MKQTEEDIWQENVKQEIKGEALKSGKKLSVFVEDFDSESFWRNVIESAKPFLRGKLFIDFPKRYKDQKGRSAMGKDHLKKFANLVDKQLIICCDADNDYLKDDQVWFYNKPFVFHTYTHSIENHKYYPQILSQITEDLTSVPFDFKTYFDWYSEEIYSILVYWLFIGKNYPYGNFLELIQWDNLKDNYLHFPAIDETNEQNFKKEIQGKIRLFTQELRQIAENEGLTNFQNEFDQFKQEIDQKNLQNESIFYLQGHAIFDLIKPFFSQVVNKKIEERKGFLQRNGASGHEITQFENSLREQNPHTLLYHSYQKCLSNHDLCSFMQKIVVDLESLE